jgi:signal transduction histidine kinase
VQTRFLHTDAFRLAAIYTGVFAVSVAVLGFGVLIVTRDALQGQIVQFARADIAAVESGYRSERIPEAVEVINQRMSVPGASDYFLLQQGSRALAGNLGPMPGRIGVLSLGGAGRPVVLGEGRMLSPGLYVFAGSELTRVAAAEDRILELMLWLFVPTLALAAAGGVLVAQAFLRRSDAMSRACRAIMDGDMRARIPLRGTQDEMDRLAATINEMLDRIAALMENLQQVTNDIAHDLRTPVTHLRHGLERALSESAAPADYAAAIDAAMRKADEMLDLFAALLRIAQIEGGARRAAFAPLDLRDVLEGLQEMFGAVAEETGHRLEAQGLAAAAIRGDRALIVQLFSNLIENALLHTPAGTLITMTLAVTGQHVRAIIGDNGPGVPKADHQKLFRRLYRRESSRAGGGYGLGLSLVAAIAELHGAGLKILDEGRAGLWIAVEFPLLHGS